MWAAGEVRAGTYALSCSSMDEKCKKQKWASSVERHAGLCTIVPNMTYYIHSRARHTLWKRRREDVFLGSSSPDTRRREMKRCVGELLLVHTDVVDLHRRRALPKRKPYNTRLNLKRYRHKRHYTTQVVQVTHRTTARQPAAPSATSGTTS